MSDDLTLGVICDYKTKFYTRKVRYSKGTKSYLGILQIKRFPDELSKNTVSL